jgi:CRISPR/Cas system-associated exonuclease Cas4 (RecB family)
LGDAEILLEPSYLCPEYGLQGRLDLLSRTADKYQIVELKSGKAPAIEVWKAHQMQVVAYNLIIRYAYGTNGKNNSSILYSASPENPLRYVVNIPILEQDLLMLQKSDRGDNAPTERKPRTAVKLV